MKKKYCFKSTPGLIWHGVILVCASPVITFVVFIGFLGSFCLTPYVFVNNSIVFGLEHALELRYSASLWEQFLDISMTGMCQCYTCMAWVKLKLTLKVSVLYIAVYIHTTDGTCEPTLIKLS